jgi:hypothetical protein
MKKTENVMITSGRNARFNIMTKRGDKVNFTHISSAETILLATTLLSLAFIGAYTVMLFILTTTIGW